MPEELDVVTALIAGLAVGVFSGVAIMAMLFAGRDLFAASEAEEDATTPAPSPAMCAKHGLLLTTSGSAYCWKCVGEIPKAKVTADVFRSEYMTEPVTPYTWLRPTNWRCQHGAEVHQWCDECYRQGAGK